MNIKKTILLAVFFALANLTLAQAPNAFGYQAVVRNSQNQIVANQPINVRISIMAGIDEPIPCYSERHTAVTNINGLFSIMIGQGEVETGRFDNIRWELGTFFIKSEIDPNGGDDFTIISTQQLMSVPFALFTNKADSVIHYPEEVDPIFTSWDKDYNSLTNRPSIPTVPDSISAFVNDAGYLTSFTETDPAFSSWDKDYNSLTNRPSIPTVPDSISAFVNDAGYLTSFTETDPTFSSWDRDYNSLTNRPSIPTVPDSISAFVNDAGYLTSFTETDPAFSSWDKDYNSLTNRPSIPTVPDSISAFVNDAGYLTTFTESQGLSDVLGNGNDAGNNQIKRVANPTDSQDVVTLAYLDTTMSPIRTELTDLAAKVGGLVGGTAVVETDEELPILVTEVGIIIGDYKNISSVTYQPGSTYRLSGCSYTVYSVVGVSRCHIKGKTHNLNTCTSFFKNDNDELVGTPANIASTADKYYTEHEYDVDVPQGATKLYVGNYADVNLATHNVTHTIVSDGVIGNVDSLETEEKNNLVEAINEVNTKAEKKSIKVLYIGSSKGSNTISHFPILAHHMGVDVVCGNFYQGSLTLQQVTDYCVEGVQLGGSWYHKFSNGAWSDSPKSTMRAMLTEEKWDCIFVQRGATEEATCTDAQIASVDTIVAYISSVCDWSPKIVMSSGFGDAFGVTESLNAQSAERAELILSSAKQFAGACGIEVMDVATPLQKCRDNEILRQLGTFVKSTNPDTKRGCLAIDVNHLDSGIGYYVMGVAVAEFLLSRFGLSARALTYLPTEDEVSKRASTDSFTGLTSSNAELVRKIVCGWYYTD